MYTAEEFDKEKTRVLKYIIYKKRSESEVRTKFARTIDDELLNDIIEYLKEAEYINDKEYIKRFTNNLMILKNLSQRELKIKLATKGLDRNLIEDYMYENAEELQEYEARSAQVIAIKKSSLMEKEEIKQYLLKKGYQSENINKALEEI
jgi:regulatory protein